MTPSQHRDERGQTLPLVIVFLICMLLFAGLVIDLGQAYRTRIQLQASADAASLAGAAMLPRRGDRASSHRLRLQRAERRRRTPIPGVPNVAVNVQTKCSKTLPNCVGANTVVVDETAAVPTTFLHAGRDQRRSRSRCTRRPARRATPCRWT